MGKKTIIINEKVLDSLEMKEAALAASLSKQLKNELKNNKTPLSNNPSFPEEYDMSFEERLTYLRFKETKNKLYQIGDMNGDDVNNLLPSLIEECKRLEKPIRRNLEKIAYNFIIETFNIPEGLVNLVVSLNDDISDTTLSVRVQAEDNEFEYENVKQKSDLFKSIKKRKILNGLMAGAALRYAENIKKYVADIYELDPKLPELYRNIIALNEYMLFSVNDIEINDKNKNQLGLSNIIIGNENIKNEVRVEAVIFPILIYEEVKAFLELSAAHGLPSSKEEANFVMGKCDYAQAEPWYMRLGPAMWDLLKKSMGDVEDALIPYIFMEISKLPNHLFETAMQEVFSGTKKGRLILSRIKEKHERSEEYQDFSNRMQMANTAVALIQDEKIYEELNKEEKKFLLRETLTLLTEISVQDAYQRFYSDIPQEDYQKIIAATKNSPEVLSPEAKWVLNLYKRKSPRLMEDLYKLHNERGEGYLDIFNRLKDTRRVTGPESDLNRYKSISELGAFTNQFDIEDVWMDANERKKNSMRPEFIRAKDDIAKSYEDDKWLIVIPKSYEASCYWGDGTEWCTAYKDSRNYYDQYASDGQLFININKQTGEKYQFHFESESYMDEDDIDIETPILDTIGATEGMKNHYLKVTAHLNNPKAYFDLTAIQNEYGTDWDIHIFNGEWYYYNVENKECEHLDFADRVSDWEIIDGMYAKDARDYIALVHGKDGKYNFINGNGELITRSWFDDYGSWDYTYGVIPVKRHGKWNIISSYGYVLFDFANFDNIKEIEDDWGETDYYIGTVGDKKFKLDKEGNYSRIFDEEEYEDY